MGDDGANYLSDPSFREQHEGPHLAGAKGITLKTRDPSPGQIRRMAVAIRLAIPRPAVGEARLPVEIPVVRSPDWFDERLA